MSLSVPKGYVVVYIGEEHNKRFVVPLSYLNEPAFQDSLNLAEEEFKFDHPMGSLKIPWREEIFIVSLLNDRFRTMAEKKEIKFMIPHAKTPK